LRAKELHALRHCYGRHRKASVRPTCLYLSASRRWVRRVISAWLQGR